MNKRIETKVVAAVYGTALGGALASAVVWLLGVFVWHASSASAHVGDAMAAVPWPVAGLVAILLVPGGAGVAGYSAPRTTDAERGDVPTLILDDPVLSTDPAGDDLNHADLP